jgi:hypothetical protein
VARLDDSDIRGRGRYQGSGVFRECALLSESRPWGGGFRRGGVVGAAFGDVQVAGVIGGCDGGGADGGQVGGLLR